MSSPPDLVDCPAACGNKVHRNAGECPHCGHRTDISRLEDLFSSLSTVSSILVGFGLAALVQLASGETKAKEDPLLTWATAAWLIASLLLLGVLLSSEVLRRREITGGRMRPLTAESERLWSSSGWLLVTFFLALVFVAGGVILLAFWFSPLHGIAACMAVI